MAARPTVIELPPRVRVRVRARARARVRARVRARARARVSSPWSSCRLATQG